MILSYKQSPGEVDSPTILSLLTYHKFLARDQTTHFSAPPPILFPPFYQYDTVLHYIALFEELSKQLKKSFEDKLVYIAICPEVSYCFMMPMTLF